MYYVPLIRKGPLKSKLLLFFFLLVSASAFAQQPGEIDLSFNPSDKGYGFGDGLEGHVNATLVQPDGKLLVAGEISRDDANIKLSLLRLHTDGSLDHSFQQVPFYSTSILALAIQADGKIIIAGNFSAIGSEQRAGIARLHPDGRLDTSFIPVTSIAQGNRHTNIQALEVQPDGKIIAGGYIFLGNNHIGTSVCRLHTNGSLDTTFQTSAGPMGTIHALKLQADGKVVAGGWCRYGNYPYTENILRLGANGIIDTTFQAGEGAAGAVLAITIQPDGKIIIGGEFDAFNNTNCNRIARLHPNGTLDTAFHTGSGFQHSDYSAIYSITLQPDNKVIAGGFFSSFDNAPASNIVRLHLNGSPDHTFQSSDLANSVTSLALETNGNIVAAGRFSRRNMSNANGIARLLPNGSLDPDFDRGTAINGHPYYYVTSMVQQPDEKLVVGGHFLRYNRTICGSIVRLHPDGSPDSLFQTGTGFQHPSTRGSISAMALQADGKLFVSGSFSSYSGMGIGNIVRLSQHGALDHSFDCGTCVDGPINTMHVQPDGKLILCGLFKTYNGVSRGGIARIHANGALDQTFNPGTGILNYFEGVRDAAFLPGGDMILVGNFSDFNGSGRSSVVRLHSDGSLDTSFHSPVEPWMQLVTIARQPDGKVLVGGEFESYDGRAIQSIVRLNPDGRTDTTFHGALKRGTASKIAFQTNGKIILAGSGLSNDTINHPNVLRLNPDGSYDSTFVTESDPSGFLTSAVLQPDGKLVVGGSFTTFHGTGRNRIVRLIGNEILPEPEPVPLTNFYPFPNPTSGSFSLDLTDVDATEPVQIKIHNVLGQLLQSNELSGGRVSLLHLRNKTLGAHYVRIQWKDQVLVRPLIVQ